MGIFDNPPPGHGGDADEFAGLDPDDLEMYWRIEHDLGRIEDAPQSAQRPVLDRYNLRSVDHGRNVQAAYHARHRSDPDFVAAARRVELGRQVQEFRANVGSRED